MLKWNRLFRIITFNLTKTTVIHPNQRNTRSRSDNCNSLSIPSLIIPSYSPKLSSDILCIVVIDCSIGRDKVEVGSLDGGADKDVFLNCINNNKQGVRRKVLEDYPLRYIGKLINIINEVRKYEFNKKISLSRILVLGIQSEKFHCFKILSAWIFLLRFRPSPEALLSFI